MEFPSLDEVDKLYKSGISKTDIAKIFGIKKSSFFTFLRRNGIVESLKNPSYSESEIDILKATYSNTSKEDILKLLPKRTWSSILTTANKLGLKRSFKYELKQYEKKSKLENLLEETHEAYYWIGFILADGCITTRNRFSLKLSEKDKQHFNKFVEYIECKNTLSEGERVGGFSYSKSSHYISVMISDKNTIFKLKEKFDIKSNKTFNPPDLSFYKSKDREFLKSLIIGFIDGDGSIKARKNRNCFSITIRSDKSWFDFFYFMKSIFEIDNSNLLPEPRLEKYRPNMVCLDFNRKETLIKLKDHIKTYNLPVLERKWNKIQYKDFGVK